MEILKSAILSKDINENYLEELYSLSSRKAFVFGQYLYSNVDDSISEEDILILVKGKIELESFNTTTIQDPGSLLGIMSSNYSVTSNPIVTSDQAIFLHLTKASFQSFLEKYPNIGLKIIYNMLSQRNKEQKAFEAENRDGVTRFVFFDCKSYDIEAFQRLTEEFKKLNVVLTFLEVKLSRDTVHLAKNSDIISLFIHDVADKFIIGQLKEYGIQLITLRSAGFDYIDLTACKEAGIPVTYTPTYSPNSISEFCIGLLLSLARRLNVATQRTKYGNLTLSTSVLGMELKGKTVGILGTGKIGRLVSQTLKAMEMNVVAFDIKPNYTWAQALEISYLSNIDELYRQSDIISLHLPLNEKTHHVIDQTSLSKMKDGVVLINTSRGGLIDTGALINALKSGKITAVALDVYEQENECFDKNYNKLGKNREILQDDHLAQLLILPNVLITCHQAYFTREALENIAQITLFNVKEFLSLTAKEGKLTNQAN